MVLGKAEKEVEKKEEGKERGRTGRVEKGITPKWGSGEVRGPNQGTNLSVGEEGLKFIPHSVGSAPPC